MILVQFGSCKGNKQTKNWRLPFPLRRFVRIGFYHICEDSGGGGGLRLDRLLEGQCRYHSNNECIFSSQCEVCAYILIGSIWLVCCLSVSVCVCLWELFMVFNFISLHYKLTNYRPTKRTQRNRQTNWSAYCLFAGKITRCMYTVCQSKKPRQTDTHSEMFFAARETHGKWWAIWIKYICKYNEMTSNFSGAQSCMWKYCFRLLCV